MKRVVPAAVFLALLPGSAHADRLAATRQQALAEVSHSVTVRIDDGVARYRVRRTFSNAGGRSEQAELLIDLAHGAAVTGLRIRARDRWFTGKLMEREEARAKYEELTGFGSWDPMDPALLEWVWANEAQLRVFPVFPGSVNTVEYTLTAPLEYANGRYVLSYPRFANDSDLETLPLAVPVLTIEPGYGDALMEIRVADQRVAPGSPVVLSAPAPPEWIGDGEPEAGVGYAFSSVDIEDEAVAESAKVEVEIDHTYSGDISVELVSPNGNRFEVTGGSGGDNDLRGEFDVEFPVALDAAGKWSLVVADNAGLDVGTLDAWSLELASAKKGQRPLRAEATGLPVFIPDASDGDGDGTHARIEIEPPKFRTMAARLGRVVASKEHGFSRLEIDAAPKLRPLPKRASVVFVVDVSFSVDEETIDEQLRIANAYLSHVPDASAEVIVVDRKPRRLFGEFVRASHFETALAKARSGKGLEQGNGSALERGLEHAVESLDGRRGPTRIVAMTDAALRTRFTNALANAALRRGPRRTVTHLVVPNTGVENGIERDDEHDLAAIPASHRGVLYLMSGPEDEKLETLRASALPLVRPVSIDHFAVRGLDLSDARDVPDALREGVGYRAMLQRASPPSRVVITGKIWAQDFRRVVRNNRHFDTATAAFVFSEDEHGDLSQEEMLDVAFKGRAVSPVTSYLATEPGVRPSTDGFGEETIGLGGVGLIGHGAGGGGLSGRLRPPKMAGLLDPAARRCEKRLTPPAGWRVEIDVETTHREIVDVIHKTATDAKMADCILEEIWSIELPGASWPARGTHTVRFD